MRVGQAGACVSFLVTMGVNFFFILALLDE